MHVVIEAAAHGVAWGSLPKAAWASQGAPDWSRKRQLTSLNHAIQDEGSLKENSLAAPTTYLLKQDLRLRRPLRPRYALDIGVHDHVLRRRQVSPQDLKLGADTSQRPRHGHASRAEDTVSENQRIAARGLERLFALE